MIRNIIVCDKCKVTEENTRTFISMTVRIDIRYISKILHLCPKCFSKLNFKEIPQKDTPKIEDQLYDIIYEIAADAASNRND